MGRSLVRAIFFLSSMVFVTRGAGEMTHQLERTIGLVFFLVFTVSFFERRFYERRWGLILLGLVLLAAGLILLHPDPPGAAAALALMTVGVWFLATGLGIPGNDAPPCALAAFLFAVLLFLGRVLPGVWYLGRWFADLACGIANGMGWEAIDFRPTFCGLPITALFLLFWISRWLYMSKRDARDLYGPIFLTLLVQVFYLMVAAWILEVSLPLIKSKAGVDAGDLTWYHAALQRHVPWNLPFLLLLMNILVVVWAITRRREDVEPVALAGGEPRRPLIATAAFLAAVIILAWSPFGGIRPRTDKPIVFYEEGFLNWAVPEFDGSYGPQSAGMFGNLPRFVEALGLQQRKIPAITSETLKGACALVVINPNEPWGEGTTETVRRFVEQGGALLLLGDHTAYDEETGRVYVNELLRPTAIRFHFDSATFAVGGWLHGYDFLWHPLTAGVGDERNEPGIVIGASLGVESPAYPLVLGRYGFEDRGNRFRPDHAFMGNSAFDATEPLGDSVLVAAQRYGEGKVMVFGDTSSFVNGILVSSHDFVGRVFRWIAAPDAHLIGAGLAWLVWILLIVALVLLFAKGPPDATILMVFALIVALVPNGARRQRERAARRPPLRDRIAYIDMAHVPKVSQEGSRDNGLMGLELNLMRNGLLPFNLYEFDERAIDEARLLVMVAPTRRFSRRDVRIVTEFLEAGGVAIMAVGGEEVDTVSEEVRASRPLLDALGLAVDGGFPLGYFRSETPVLNAEAMFWEAWRVEDKTGDARVICGHGEFPVILEKPVGQGRFVLIGDSNFFLNKNLEGEKSYNETNIDFLRVLLGHLGVTGEAAP